MLNIVDNTTYEQAQIAELKELIAEAGIERISVSLNLETNVLKKEKVVAELIAFFKAKKTGFGITKGFSTALIVKSQNGDFVCGKCKNITNVDACKCKTCRAALVKSKLI